MAWVAIESPSVTTGLGWPNVATSLAKEERVSVAPKNSLSRQGIAASCRYSERGVAIGVDHDRVGQAKPSARDRLYSRSPAGAIGAPRMIKCARAVMTGNVATERLCCDRPPMLFY